MEAEERLKARVAKHIAFLDECQSSTDAVTASVDDAVDAEALRELEQAKAKELEEMREKSRNTVAKMHVDALDDTMRGKYENHKRMQQLQSENEQLRRLIAQSQPPQPTGVDVGAADEPTKAKE